MIINSIIKKSGLILIGLAGIIIFAHAVYPHHHHFNYIHQEEHSDKQSGNPLHCHAFNNLIINKTGVSINKFSISNSLLDVIFENDIHLRISENYCRKIKSINQNDSPPAVVFFKNTPTRGSPANV